MQEEIARIEADARVALGGIADAAIQGKEFERLRRWGLGFQSGGIRGVDMLNGEDLWMIAHLYFDVGDFHSGYALLGRAADHQERYLRLLEAAVANPRRSDSRKMLEQLGLVGAGSVSAHPRAVDQARLMLSGMRDQLSTLKTDLTGEHLGPFYSQRPFRLYMEDTLRRDIDHQLDADRGDAELLVFLRAYINKVSDGNATHLDDLEVADMEYVRRLWSLPERFNTKDRLIWHLTKGPNRFERRDSRNEVMAMVADTGTWRDIRISGIAAVPEFKTSSLSLKRAETSDDVRRLWRGLILDETYHSAGSIPEGGPRNVKLVIAAGEEALRGLIVDGGEPILLRALDCVAQSRNLYRETYPGGAERGYRDGAPLWFGVRLRTRRGQDFVDCCAALPLDVGSKARVPHRILEDAYRAEAWPDWLASTEPPPVVDWSSAAISSERAQGATRPRGNTPALSDVLRSVSCDHRSATWAPGKLFEEPGSAAYRSAMADTAILSCPACLNRRVAMLPAHRLPDGHELLAAAHKDPQRYLDLQYGAETLSGAKANRASTIDELRTRDGIASLDPSSYAPLTAEAPRGGRRVRSVGDAMRRH